MSEERKMYSPNKSVRARVKKHLDDFSNPSDCWIWPMSKTASGYGQLSSSEGSAKRRFLHYAHRVSYALTHGDFPSDLMVCHKCDNPSCFNPAHLFLGTAKVNMRDCIRKGRFRGSKGYKAGDSHWTRANPEKLEKSHRGVNGYQSKLTEDQVRHIRSSGETGVALARKYNMCPSSISKVRRRETYVSVV